MTAFAEMAAMTNYSFLRGASHPADMVGAALEAGHSGIGIADRNSVAGVVRAWAALRKGREDLQAAMHKEGILEAEQHLDERFRIINDFKLAVGARLVFADGTPDIIAYPRNREAWGRLTRLLTIGNRRAIKGDCILLFNDLLDHLDDLLLIVLPTTDFLKIGDVGARPHPKILPKLALGRGTTEGGGGEGQDIETLRALGLVIAERCADPLERTLTSLGKIHPDHVWLGVKLSYGPRDRRLLAHYAALADRLGVPLLATNEPLYATSAQRPLHDVVTCIRHGVTLAGAGTRLDPNAERHIKSGDEMARLFALYPQAIAESLRLLDRIKFDLIHLKYEYPHEPVPPGWTPQAWLRRLVVKGAIWRYGRPLTDAVKDLIRHELDLVGKANYAYYFLTVHDVVEYARSVGILCQGRGSAANSIICYALGVTSIDPVKHKLLFSRFISADRNEPPDIDVDFEHERREEVMQYIYRRYGRHRAGIAATVIHYRPRSAVREVGKVVGISEDITSQISSTVWGSYGQEIVDDRIGQAGLDIDNPEIARLGMIVKQLLEFPRHLSQHVGGFVLTERRLDELVPIHNAAMDDRTFIEWDKDDIDALKLMKVDVLALGMLTCIRKAFDLLEAHADTRYTLATVPEDQPDVYAMLCKGESIGVFQVESRAQINMLPRLRPDNLYDLAVQVAIVRPGPIQGGMVHPYLRKRKEQRQIPPPPIVFPAPHPDQGPANELEDVLLKTLGVPLFQEQAMKLAIVAAKFSDSEANQLRRAMATFRNVGTMPLFEEKMVEGMVTRGYPRDFAEGCFRQIKGFGSYGFPESHAQSFALLVYVSSYLKCRYPAVFACALLNSQPMGFYAPAQIISDARKNHVEVLEPDINFSKWDNSLEPMGNMLALRIGLRQVDGFREAWAEEMVKVRAEGRFDSIEALARRASLPRRALRLLADADAYGSLGFDRRQALWEARRTPDGELPLFQYAKTPELGEETDARLPEMPLSEQVAADYQTTRISLKGHPMQFLRELFRNEGIRSCAEIDAAKNGTRARVAGVVLVRQRPGEGKAIFITIEDETGITNVLLWARTFEAQRRQVMASRLMEIEGEIQRSPEGVVHLMGARVIDRTAELERLSEDHKTEITLSRADVFEHPQMPRHAVPRGSHPRKVRILPRSRDFH